MFSWVFRSFKRQVVLFMLGFVIMAATVSVYEFYSSETKQLNNILVSQVTQLSHGLSLLSSSNVFYNRYYDLSNIVIDIIKNNEASNTSSGSLFKIENIAIVNNADEIVSHSDPLKYPLGVKYTRLYETENKEILAGVDFVWNDERSFLFVRTPIKYNNEVIGYIHLDINPVYFSLSERQLINNVSILVFVFVFVMFVFSYIFGRWVNRPLVDLMENIKNIGNGNVRFNVAEKRKDEFCLLAMALMEADKRLHNHKLELLDIQRGLESSVKSRTVELSDKTDELSITLNDLKKYQKQMVESEKMSALGSLVAGVSHEINTPIGVSLTGSTHIEAETKIILSLLHNDGLGKKSLKEYLEMVEEMSRSMCVSLLNAANLVRSFKQVAIDQHTELKRDFNLKKYADEVLLSLHNKLTHVDVNVKNEFDESIEMFSYAGMFSQIWTNFIMNSLLHAFDDGVQGAEIILKSEVDDDELILIYEDNGKGIPENDIDKVFEPFFTTKLGKGGSGLGLNIIYNLVNHKLKGEILCSNKKRGMQMKITIPMKELRNE